SSRALRYCCLLFSPAEKSSSNSPRLRTAHCRRPDGQGKASQQHRGHRQTHDARLRPHRKIVRLLDLPVTFRTQQKKGGNCSMLGTQRMKRESACCVAMPVRGRCVGSPRTTLSASSYALSV